MALLLSSGWPKPLSATGTMLFRAQREPCVQFRGRRWRDSRPDEAPALLDLHDVFADSREPRQHLRIVARNDEAEVADERAHLVLRGEVRLLVERLRDRHVLVEVLV